MSDLFDNISFHFGTMMLVAFKLVGFISWSWWLVCAPSIIALILFIFSVLSSD